MKRLVHWFGRIALMIVATGISILIAEAVLRLSGMFPTGGVHTVTTREFETIPGMFSPHQSVRVLQIHDLPYQVTINSLGFRGRDFRLQKEEGETRVVVVGDSFTFGDYVDDEQTLPARLEQELGRKCTGVRVINAGVGGTTIIDQIHIASRALALAPDVMVHVFYENDVRDLRHDRSMWDDIATNREKKSRFPYSIAYRVLRSSALWSSLMTARGVLRAGEEEAPAAAATSDERLRQAVELRTEYASRLAQLRDTLAARGVPLLATAFPSHHTLDGTASWDQLHWFRGTVHSLGLQYVDLAAHLAAELESVKRFYLLPRDGHASDAGNVAAARRLAEDVARTPALARACSPQ